MRRKYCYIVYGSEGENKKCAEINICSDNVMLYIPSEYRHFINIYLSDIICIL